MFRLCASTTLRGVRAAGRSEMTGSISPASSALPCLGQPVRHRSDIFKNFWDNLQTELKKNKDIKEGLAELQKQKESIAKSESVQKTKETLGQATDTVRTTVSSTVSSRFTELREALSKAVSATMGKASEVTKDISKEMPEMPNMSSTTERARKAAEAAAKTTEKVTSNPLVKGVTGKVSKVKEELFDKAARSSAPYQKPERLQKRSAEGSAESASAEGVEEEPVKVYKENTDEQQVTLHKDSTWQTQWQEWRDNSVLMQRMFDAKKGFDESDSLFARATRSIGERITGSFGQMFSETETATALREITKIDPSFSEDAFLDDVERRIIPTVLEAFVQGDLPTLKDWCHEGAFNMLKSNYEYSCRDGLKPDVKILDIRDVNILSGKILDQGPVMIMTFGAQQNSVLRDKAGKIIEGDVDKIDLVMYVMALCRDQSIFDPRSAWRVLEMVSLDKAEIF